MDDKPHSHQSPQECHRLAQKLRQHAQNPNVPPELRKECLRQANNLRFVARVRAKRNRHPEHPTKQ